MANPPAQKINRETALGLMTANIAIPGSGTFLAGRRIIGAIQVMIAMGGLGVSLIMGLKMVLWMLSNWARLQDPYADPFESLREMWLAIRWPLAGIAMFAFAWLWAFVDSLLLLRKTPRKRVPPHL